GFDILDAGNAPGCEDGDADVLGQAHGGVDVDARQHAVAADVGVDDGLAAVVFELLGQVEHVVARELAPAIGGDLAVARVQAHDDAAGEGAAGVMQEARVLYCGRADDDIRNAGVEVGLDRVQVADAAADLDRDLVADGIEDRLDGGVVFGLARHGAIQVDQMQAARAQVEPVCGHGGGVFREYRCLVEVSLAQAYAAPVFEIDGGDQQHGGYRALKNWLKGPAEARTERLWVPVYKIAVQPQTVGRAFLGMELHGENVLGGHGARKCNAVVGLADRQRGIGGRGIVTVHEIEMRMVGDARP